MEKYKLRSPFFVCNPKAYLYGEDTLKLAKKCEELAVKYDFDVIYTAQHVDLAMIAKECPHLIVTAQAMESLKPGRGMGHILPEALKAAGVKHEYHCYGTDERPLWHVFHCDGSLKEAKICNDDEITFFRSLIK